MSQPGGGGAETHARSRQYANLTNSSLVLTTDSRSRDTHEPTGEPETLWGKIDAKTFGDRVSREKPPELDQKIKKRKKDEANTEDLPLKKIIRKKRWAGEEESVLSLSDIDSAYSPKTKETRAAYEAMLSVIQEQLGGRPQLRCAVDEVLVILKDEKVKNEDKKKEIEKLVNSISNKIFDQMVYLGKLITDFHDANEDLGIGFQPNGQEGILNDEIGVAVEFDEDDEGDDINLDRVQEESEEEEEAMQMDRINEDESEQSDKGITVNVQDIDAYWLQRKISQAYNDSTDPHKTQQLAEQILKILAQGDEREVESRLVQLLEYDKFDLVKLVVRNRFEIFWSTRLARAETRDERKRIEEEIRSIGPIGVAILDQLYTTRASAMEKQKNSERSIRDETKCLLRRENNDSSASRGACMNDQRQLLDLDTLAFQQETRFLESNEKPKLPEGTYFTRHNGYDEYHVPALKPNGFFPGEKTVKISDLPEWTRPAFSGMKELNRVQSQVYDAAFNHVHNLLLCAPTGAGKTNVAMLTILNEIGKHIREDGGFDNSDYKIVYIAPMKALVAEVVGNLSNRLNCFGVNVRELSGDQNLTRGQIEETQIIVTTPEKWDIVTRKSGDRTYTQLVKLLIIDEIHLLHDNRGPVLESIVARTIRQVETTRQFCRLVGLSATLPNFDDVALFLRVGKEGLFHFDNTYRPCPLAQQYIGITVKKPLQRFQLMNEICYEKVVSSAGKHQVLIFVHSRKETANTARAIRDTALANDTLTRFLKHDSASREILTSQIELVESNDLKDLLPYGFAIHHAGLGRLDRDLVEELFADGHVQVLVSTATLAWGVNLPAHTVIIKGTQVYSSEKGAWTELSPLDVMQMLGRAGRPQYDSYGEGIIMTEKTNLNYYLSLMNQQLPIESQFVAKLTDQLNAEIVSGSVQNMRDACTWLGYTYLFVRMLRNPTLYGMPRNILDKDKLLEERRADLIHSAANLLEKYNLIKYDKKSGYFQGTELGRIASYYYITHGTICTYNEYLKPTMGDIDLFRLFSLSEEFKYVSVSQDEKIELAKLMDRMPIPIKESLEEPSAKINVLLQSYISRLRLDGHSLSSDMIYIQESAGRLLRALFEIVTKRGWAELAKKALNLCKMVDKRMWSVQFPLRQFTNIPNEILTRLEKKDLDWDRYGDLSAQEIGELIRYPKMGRTIHKSIHEIPKINLSAHVQPITRSVLGFELIITPDFKWEDKVHGHVEPFWVIVEDNDSEYILHHEYFLLKKQYIDEDHTINFTVPIYEPLPPQFFISVVSDKWLGSHTVMPVCFKHLILPEKFAPFAELLDLQPLPVTALQNPNFEGLYDTFKHFNPIQTQVFNVLYNTDDNVLVSAPTGSGKTICAEFALLRTYQKSTEMGTEMRTVYIAPIEALAKERYRDWKEKFEGRLGICVVELTGETLTDLKLLEKGQIIIGTPEKWDALSRRWKQRKQVQQISLFIVDELHLIGGESGPVLEVIVSRMRRISSQIENNIRIIALSASIVNGKDLGEWIGATSHGLFNFSPKVRPVPLEIHIQGVDIVNFEARMQAMTKPTYTAISQHAKNGKPALVFVPTRKHVRLTALDICAYVFSEHGDKDEIGNFHSPYLLWSKEEIKPFIEKVKEETLQHALTYGVGYLHEGLTELDQEIVIGLFLSGRIQVCVASGSMCWGRSLSAHLVVVMGTQYYDARENARTDYPITELLQMMGHANRPLKDDSSKCVILCHAPKKEYYKKFLYEAFPLESQLQHFLHDHINAEIAVGSVENKQDAVDYLTWSFMYRRLTKNPNYYNLQGVSRHHLSDHLSELIENVLADLEASKCVAIEEDMYLKSLNSGLISSYYYISYATVERFGSLLVPDTKTKGLLDVLSSASEYANLPIRPCEENQIKKLINHQRFSVDNPRAVDAHLKANALLQAHFSRRVVVGNLAKDQREVVLSAHRLLQAMVDVISSNGWLETALSAMELSQMVTQGMWGRDSVLTQLPHFGNELAKKCKERGVETVFHLVKMEDSERRAMLNMSYLELMDIVRFCNRYPNNIDMSCEVIDAAHVGPGGHVTLQVILERETEVGPVDAQRYPKVKEEGWWVVVGDESANQLLAIKRVCLQRKRETRLVFAAPNQIGRKEYKVYLICDSYLGCDQDYSFFVDVNGTSL